MRAVITLKKHRRVFDWAILGIVDNPCNGCGFLAAFVLAMRCNDAHRCERNVYAECTEHPNNFGSKGDHQDTKSVVPGQREWPGLRNSFGRNSFGRNSNADFIAQAGSIRLSLEHDRDAASAIQGAPVGLSFARPE
jgi:NAD-dependent dihydropyrimidine dehydrogenase PreA subunit